MKKFLALVVALMMCCALVPAMAEGVPSKTTIDMTQVEVKTATGVVPAADFAVTVDTESTVVTTVVAQMVAAAATAAPVEFFGTEARASLVTMLPGVDVAKLVVNEIAPIKVAAYDAAYGDIDMTITTATVYTDGQQIAAMVGIVNGTEITWNVQKAEVKDGKVVVTFTPEVLELMNNNEAIIAIVG